MLGDFRIICDQIIFLIKFRVHHGLQFQVTMNFSNTEEAFVLASLKQFVILWGSGNQAHFNLECRNGQAWARLDCQLGHPASPHYPQPQEQPAHISRHKGPARRKKDHERASAHRAKKLAPSSSSSAAAAEVFPDASSGILPPPPLDLESAEPVEETQEAVPATLHQEAATIVVDQPEPQHEALQVASPQPIHQQEDSLATGVQGGPPPQVQQLQVVPVHGIAVFDNCPVEILTEEYADSLRRFFASEDHLVDNISGTELYHQSSRSFRGNIFTHTVAVVIYVRTGRLWESPASYVRKHLGYPNNEWSRSNGTVVKLSRIHQK